jgi:hypothetical protein
MSRLPFELSIPKPCSQKWSEMPGSAAVRHCAACNKEVHNLAALTSREIERLIAGSAGHFCARITRNATNGELVTGQLNDQSPFLSTFVLASTLFASAALAEDGPKMPATVTGTVLTPRNSKYIPADSPREIMFIRDGKAVSTVVTDSSGRFSATLPAGTYDVVFRSGILFGERVRDVNFHAGSQEFAPVYERFDYGHLSEVDQPAQTFATMGELISVPVYRITPRNLLTHPVGVVRTLAFRAKRLLHLSS